MTPTPAKEGAFLAACAAAMTFRLINVDTDPYTRSMERAQRSMRRVERHVKHMAGSWRGDGVQPAETRQMRRARERAAAKRKAVKR